MSEINDRKFKIIVPMFDNSGRKIKSDELEDVAKRISNRFEGVTVNTGVAGCFIPDEGEHKGELMCEENAEMWTIRDSEKGVPPEEDADWFKSLANELSDEFGQFSVFVAEDVVEVDFVGRGEDSFKQELSPDKTGRDVFRKLL